jgi:hypothetical protein
MRGAHRRLNGTVASMAAVVVLVTCTVAGAGCGTSARSSDGKNLSIESVRLQPSDIGQGWKLEKEVTADPAEAATGSTLSLLAGLGASRVLNQIFVNGSDRLQVNLVQLDSAEKSSAAAMLMSGEAGNDNIYGSRQNIAVEVISADAAAARKAFKALGAESVGPEDVTGNSLEPGKTWRVSFDIACVETIDYMKSNELSNYLESYTEGTPVDPAMKAIIDSTTFGDNLTLLTSGGGGLKGDPSVERAEFTFAPANIAARSQDGITTYTFDAAALKNEAGVPYVSVSGTVTPVTTDIANGDGTVLTPAQAQAWTAGTTFWPTGDPTVQSAVAEAVNGAADPADRLDAVWSWVASSIKYSGPPGTRYGTVKVLQQKFGRCWDKADVFVTLCRAAGVPAREVAGWLHDESGGAGHVWAQAYLAGKGWISVDCTSDHIGAGTDYVPFFATYDGAMPILYVKMPTIR